MRATKAISPIESPAIDPRDRVLADKSPISAAEDGISLVVLVGDAELGTSSVILVGEGSAIWQWQATSNSEKSSRRVPWVC